MKLSLNWIRQLNDQYKCAAEPAPAGVDALIDKIGLQLGAVEEVKDLTKKYQLAFIVKVVKCEKHPAADKLSLCLIDDGGFVTGVDRDKEGLVQVVCGAPNVRVGMLAVWLPPGATVPSTFDKDPFILGVREIRGQLSNGMLASAKELDLGNDHEGILEIDHAVMPGLPFGEEYGLEDTIIDIENKMFTHRPDLFGQLGIAREIAGIQHQVFKSPAWYLEDAQLKTDGRSNGLKLQIKNDVPKLVPRFCAVALKDIQVSESPLWLKVRLSTVGIRPINNIVDITNFYMMETAQPLHAYDYDKLKSGSLGARLSQKGEKLKLIGNKEINLDDGVLVITNGQKPIGLGGVMGGAETEVDENTRNIILEVANFNMNLTRKTAMHYGLFTDAATRFTKNQSPRQNRAVIVKAVEDILKIAGGRVASPLLDDNHTSKPAGPIKLSAEFVNRRLGLKLPAGEMAKLLENVEFIVESTDKNLSVVTPFWRTDIQSAEDIVEEVGRLYGYDRLPVSLPRRDLSPPSKDRLLEFKAKLREIMKRAGANEVLTYSFVHGSLLQKVGQDPKEAYHIRNAISPDLQYFRLSLTPSLLDRVQPNLRGGFEQFALYELGKGHNQKMKDKTGLPVEFEMLALVVASKNQSFKKSGAPFFQAKKLLEYLAGELGFKLEFRPLSSDEPYQVAKPFAPSRSAQVWVEGREIALGLVGEYKQSVVRSLKLPAYCAGFEIDLEQLLQAKPNQVAYQPLNRFPQLEQDFNLRTSMDLSYRQLADFIQHNLDKLSKQRGYEFMYRPLDIFQKPGDKNHKQTTWRIILWHPERTLTTKETNQLLDELAKVAKKELKAERI